MVNQTLLPISLIGALGNNTGAGSDGVHVGSMTAQSPSGGFLKSLAQPCLCITDDGGLFVDETTPANEATADDVEIVGATLAVDDAIYIGHATLTFAQVDALVGVEGDYTTTTFAVEYWDGTAYTAVSGLTGGDILDGQGTGLGSMSYTLPSDWAQNTVDGVNGYWIRIRCTATAATVTQAELSQIWVVVAAEDGVFTDDTTDLVDAGAADVALLPAHPVVGDGFYFQHATEKFCKIFITTSTAAVATWTVTLKYWNGTAYAAVTSTLVEDDTAGFTTTAGALIIHFVPPTDWVPNTAANGPGGSAGYTVAMEITAFTSLTTAPVASIATLGTLTTGMSGISLPGLRKITRVDSTCTVNLGAAADSVFAIVNITRGTATHFTMAKGVFVNNDTTPSLSLGNGDLVAVVQITEDGTAEISNAVLYVRA